MKNKILITWVVFCFVAPVVTTGMILYLQKILIRMEVKRKLIAGLDRDSLILIKLSETEKQTQLHWEHPNEFEYKGKWYDLVELKVIGDTTYFWVWCDDEETTLNKLINKQVDFAVANNTKGENKENRFVNFLKTLFLNNENKIVNLACLGTKRSFLTYRDSYVSISFSPFSPPPEQIFYFETSPATLIFS